ncbi:hypothetical protein GCM10023149_48600 [Mucilaginibacter gynuensis]|uniref:Uncharacterized protein n=1 Tax=Mucilaginibacter gynuensis TaxID=1302236 RepID=A0ABP8HFT4_9SPHI
MNVTQLIKGAAGNGVIGERMLKIAAQVDEEREKTINLLRELERHVGMHHGEKINAHIAEMTGTYFNERDYHYERPVGEQ